QPGLRDPGRAVGGLMARRLLDIGRGPDRMEGLVEAKTGIDVPGELIGRADDCLERGAHEGVAVLLAAGQRAGIAPQEGKMGPECFTERHESRYSSVMASGLRAIPAAWQARRAGPARGKVGDARPRLAGL